MDANEEAASLIEAHGRKASQVVIDEIVAAVRAGEDDRAAAKNEVLRAIERLSWRSVLTQPS